MGPVGVGRRAVKEGGYGLTTVPPALPYPTPPKPGTLERDFAVSPHGGGGRALLGVGAQKNRSCGAAAGAPAARPGPGVAGPAICRAAKRKKYKNSVRRVGSPGLDPLVCARPVQNLHAPPRATRYTQPVHVTFTTSAPRSEL